MPSNNFLAEMLLKDVGAQFGDSGSTAAGIAVVRQFASQRARKFKGENGSGLTRRNRASPASVVKLLDSMQSKTRRAPRRLDQLARRRGPQRHRSPTGCGARRPRGAAMPKTGTLNRVSALSGYCFRGGNDPEHAVIFSLLMNKPTSTART